MGCPRLVPNEIPTLLAATKDERAIDSSLHLLGNSYNVTAVGMGNPHAVVFVETDPKTMTNPSFASLGPALESHPDFPEKANAEFVQVISRHHVNVRVWERGAGPTLACGTGACAVTVAGVLSGRTERVVTVTLPGGDLHIEWREADNHVYMTGPAALVFQGTISLPVVV
eukprot:gene21334-27364_t